MRTAAILFVGLSVSFSTALDLVASEPPHIRYQVGDFVVVNRRAELKVEDKVVDTVEAGVLLGVDRVQGEWLWVTSQKSGWLSSGNVMPAKQAVEYFTTAIRQSPTDARLFARRGVARALNQDFKAALKDYNEALRLKPSEAVYYGDRGCFYLALGDFDRAIADFAEEIKRIDSEDETRRTIRLEWLNQRLVDAQALKSQDTTVTLDNPK